MTPDLGRPLLPHEKAVESPDNLESILRKAGRPTDPEPYRVGQDPRRRGVVKKTSRKVLDGVRAILRFLGRRKRHG